MTEQFFGSTFKGAVIIIVGLYTLAVIGYFVGLSAFLLVAIGLFTFVLSLNKLEHGLFIVFIELFSNAHGQLISTEILGFNLSLRMVIFVAVMAAWLVHLVRRRFTISISDPRLRQFAILAFAVVIGFTNGFVRNQTAVMFGDGNAYLYLAYLLPILSIAWTVELKNKLLQLLAAGAVWSMSLSAIVLYVFTHLDEVVLQISYDLLRDLRIAEVTNLGGGVYRVFMQTHFFVGAFLLLLLAMLFQRSWTLRQSVPVIGALIATLILSLSRSFWVGFMASFLALTITVCLMIRPKFSAWVRGVGQITLSVILSTIIIAVIVLFPIPQQSSSGSALAEALSRRATESGDVALSSRWNLLTPMINSIKTHTIIGSGFGTSVTFESDDPRVRELSEDGTWSTVAMEWGWLELWIKMGILGPVGFFTLASILIKHLLAYRWTDQSWLGVGLITSISFLYFTHFFSPYLNHPIGLGFLLFVVPFLPQTKKSEAVKAAPESLMLKTKGVAVATIETS